tara:strand:- start:1360 stop:3120 length:1761 start_codon:yes stop_codon:yes gene_type:complete
MTSFFLNFLICSTILLKVNEFKNNYEAFYSLTAISLLLSFAINGLLGISFVFLEITYIPLFIFLSIVLSLLMLNISLRNNFIFFIKLFKQEFIEIFNIYKKNNFIKIVLVFLLLLLLVSFGPINHSDAVNAYVGYPYKFWIKNQHFVDGNLNQGLLGVGDFSNIFYFQDKTMWLIRFTEFIPLILVFSLIVKRRTNKIIILVILSSPVLIQWMSIGKNSFFCDTCVVVIFLVWEKFKSKRDLLFLISALLISISFKLSALLICIPIFIYLIIFYKNEILKLNFFKISNFLFTLPFVISLICLITIFVYRFYLFDNPFFPLFSSIFNSDDQQLLDWEKTLREWERSSFFQLWIFLPQSINKISFVLGPANLILFIGTILFIVKEQKAKIKKNTIIGISQFVLLLLFGQGRADYYVSPILLTYVGISDIEINLTRNIAIKKLLSFALIIQLCMFLASSLYLIYTNAIVIANYQKGMDKVAWNFYNSRIITEKAINPVFSESTGMSHLFFKDDFISNNAFQRCFYYINDNSIKNKYLYCVKELGIKTIIVDKNKLKDDINFYCDPQKLIRVSRNIFLTRKKEVDFCFPK